MLVCVRHTKAQSVKKARCIIKGVCATGRIVQLMTMCKTAKTGIDKQVTGISKILGWVRWVNKNTRNH